jgi:PhzF family phenazine biosynthesis protein
MATEIPLYQVDAFTSHAFRGNPAAVCPLPAGPWLPDEVLQAIAAENNLSETAYFRPRPENDGFDLRWFTPAIEVDLCGHATLASAFVVMTALRPASTRVAFHTSRSGVLTVTRNAQDGRLVMDFPARPPSPIAVPPGIAEALGATPAAVVQARDLVAVFDDADAVRGLRPDFAKIAALDTYALCATAPGTGADADVDFVSRFFAPRAGIPEDPVTGSAHCTLIPYWAERLGRKTVKARQVSARTGEMVGTVRGDRVDMVGDAVVVIKGTLFLP